MGFITAVSSGFRRYAKFSGRATRPEFWYFSLAFALCNFAGRLLDRVFGAYFAGTDFSRDPLPAGDLTALIGLIFLLPHLAVAVRRLHDTGHSGWWYLAMLLCIFLAGFLMGLGSSLLAILAPLLLLGSFLLLIFWLCRAGMPGDNRFGPPPSEATISVPE